MVDIDISETKRIADFITQVHRSLFVIDDVGNRMSDRLPELVSMLYGSDVLEELQRDAEDVVELAWYLGKYLLYIETKEDSVVDYKLTNTEQEDEVLTIFAYQLIMPAHEFISKMEYSLSISSDFDCSLREMSEYYGVDVLWVYDWAYMLRLTDSFNYEVIKV